MGVFGKLIQCTMPILYIIPSPYITPLHKFWAFVLLTIILLLFRVDVPKFSKPTYSAENVTHLNPSLPVCIASKCSDKTEFQTRAWCLQTKAPVRNRAFVVRWRHCILLLLWDEDIAFLGHTEWSTKHSGSDQIGTAKDTWSQVLAPVNHLGSYLSLCTHKLIHKQSWHNPIVHPVLTSRVVFFVFFLFIQILIDLYLLSREEFN